MQENSYYVYILLDPRTLPQKPFYIGISNSDRVRDGMRVLDHYSSLILDEESPAYRNHHKSNLIKKLNKLGYDPCYYIWRDNLSKDQACSEEIRLIERFGRSDKGNGVLTNKTDGGDGNPGVIYSEERREKLSRSKRKYPDEIVLFCLDKRFKEFYTATQISKMSEIKQYPTLDSYKIQTWISGSYCKYLSKDYPTIEESDANLCLQVHISLYSGCSPKEIKNDYRISNGTFNRIKNFEFKWSKHKDYVEELISIGGQL